MPNVTFKGFRQVTKAYFDSLEDEQKMGYLWFVRSNITADSETNTETYEGDIFLGTRCYGHHGSDVEVLEDRLNRILYNAGVLDESGNTVVLSDIYLTKVEADELYVTNDTLFNEAETQDKSLGILVIGGDDTNNE